MTVFGHFVNHDLAEYHIATCADIPGRAAEWIEEDDKLLGHRL